MVQRERGERIEQLEMTAHTNEVRGYATRLHTNTLYNNPKREYPITATELSTVT